MTITEHPAQGHSRMRPVHSTGDLGTDLETLFARLDRFGANLGATARIVCGNGRVLGLRAGPGSSGWPLRPPFTAYDVWAPEPLSGALWARYRTDSPHVYVTVPKLLVCDQLLRYGGATEVLVGANPRRARILVEAEVDMPSRDSMLTAVLDAVANSSGNACIKKTETILR